MKFSVNLPGLSALVLLGLLISSSFFLSHPNWVFVCVYSAVVLLPEWHGNMVRVKNYYREELLDQVELSTRSVNFSLEFGRAVNQFVVFLIVVNRVVESGWLFPRVEMGFGAGVINGLLGLMTYVVPLVCVFVLTRVVVTASTEQGEDVKRSSRMKGEEFDIEDYIK